MCVSGFVSSNVESLDRLLTRGPPLHLDCQSFCLHLSLKHLCVHAHLHTHTHTPYASFFGMQFVFHKKTHSQHATVRCSNVSYKAPVHYKAQTFSQIFVFTADGSLCVKSLRCVSFSVVSTFFRGF